MKRKAVSGMILILLATCFLELFGYVYSSPAVVDGKTYIESSDGKFYVFGLPPTYTSAITATIGETINPGSGTSHAVFVTPWRDWAHYHNYTEIVNTLFYLNAPCPTIVNVFPIGRAGRIWISTLLG